MSLASGSRLGPYEIIAPLGAGGMGEVYRARDARLDRDVAIKVLPEHLAQDPAALKRFEREAKAIAALSHPNILNIHDFGEQTGFSYAVMELLDGVTLRQLIAGSPVPVQKALNIAIEIADGLAAAHSKGVIHRDLKPDNIFITADQRVKILDFGLARWAEPVSKEEKSQLETGSMQTQAGTILGTLSYMSPEQVRGMSVDERTDIFSFGCVLYEMLTGKRAFLGESSADIVTAILKEQPHSGIKIAPQLQQILNRCLAKNPEQRYRSAQELATELKSYRDEISHPHLNLRKEFSRNIRRPIVAVPLLVLLILIGFGTMRLVQKRQRIQWAREQAVPEINRLILTEDYRAAVQLARTAQEQIPDDQALKQLWPKMSRAVNVHTNPEGADVSIRDYKSSDDWQLLGKSPLKEVRIPLGLFHWKFEKEGYEAVDITERFPYVSPTKIETLQFGLDKQGTIPPRMVRVPQKEFALQMPGLDHLPAVQLDEFLIDRYEVTNQEFLEFVKGGGYQTKEYWKHPFMKGDRELSWDEAMSEFRDGTGRPGPATWEAGTFIKGQEKYPVTGVSWYEAAAYAEFAEKSLPTAYHWNYAAGSWDSSYVIPLSNFGRNGLVAVGTKSGIHRFGTYDMAGNAKEWCFNASGNNRFILGGAWNEPTYLFNDPDAQPPISRRPTYGFRCVKYLKPVSNAAAASIQWATRDYRKEKPVSDEIFNAYKSLYSYDKKELQPVIESSVTSESWKKEKITFDAGYGNERMVAYLFLPRNTPPPYQTVIYFPGSGVLYLRSTDQLEGDLNMTRLDFVIQSGRAVLYPIYEGTFGRGQALNSDYPTPTSAYRDHVIHWYKEMARSVDYLETRKDIDSDKLAFYGTSWGGALGMILPALESRFKANVLVVGGFYLQKTLPEADQINFVSRVTVPTLMLNGRHDFFLPIETAQLPAFEYLGTPKEHKRQVIYETGHNIPRNELIRETLNWLDRYLGPVAPSR
jgi:eukaryotic-like serine/threonine-protein kinase